MHRKSLSAGLEAGANVESLIRTYAEKSFSTITKLKSISPLGQNGSTMRSGNVQEPKDIGDHADLREIYEHAFFLRTLYLTRSMGGAARALKVVPRSVFNHIQWMECLTGEKLLEDVAPGQTAQLTTFGEELGERLVDAYHKTALWLNRNKMDKVTGATFTEVIKQHYSTYRRSI